MAEFDILDGWDDEKIDVLTDDMHGEEGVQLITAEVEDALGSLQHNQFDAIVTDPPYKVNISHWDKELPPPEVWMKCVNCLKPGGHLVIFGQPSMSLEFFEVMSAAKFKLDHSKNKSFTYRDTWIWAYQGTHTKGIKSGDFRSKIRNIYNPIYVFRKELEGSEEENWNKYKTNLLNINSVRQEYKGNHSGIIKKYIETGEKHLQSEIPSHTFKGLHRKGWVPNDKGAEPTNIQYCPRATKVERTINNQIENNHETVKPVSIMLWVLNLVTNNTEQTVLDCFMGTGSTGMACKLLGRKFVGIDKNVKMAELAKFRINHVFEVDPTLFKRSSL